MLAALFSNQRVEATEVSTHGWMNIHGELFNVYSVSVLQDGYTIMWIYLTQLYT